ncbi:MAG: SsrA-binding protein SmpB [Balneolaceae bacterium]
MSKSSTKPSTPVIQNRKARFDYHIEETWEAGLSLMGTEVKSLRAGKASLHEAFAAMQNGELWLRNMYIKPYEHGSYSNHDERRERKLLLKRRELKEIDRNLQGQGTTIIPLKLYFKKGYAKILIGLARGKKKFDKRQDIKEKDTRRELQRKVKGDVKINM